ncbi:hypothetical protein BJX99DRAFT_262602 [Aspergillus californicus]
MRVIAVFAALLALASATPAPLEKRQQGENCIEVFYPDACSDSGLVYCDGAGSIQICCVCSAFPL